MSDRIKGYHFFTEDGYANGKYWRVFQGPLVGQGAMVGWLATQWKDRKPWVHRNRDKAFIHKGYHAVHRAYEVSWLLIPSRDALKPGSFVRIR